MKLITERDLIRKIAASWFNQYQAWFKDYPDKKITYGKLLALDKENASPADIESIIGNDAWTAQYCNECKELSTIIVEVGEEPGYDSSTAKICPDCLQKALALVQGERQ